MRAGGGLRIRGDQQRRPDGASRRQAVAGGEEEHHGRERIVDVRRALQDPAALAQDVDEVPPLVPPGVGGRQCAGAVAVTVELVDGRVHPGHAQHAGVEGAVEHLGHPAQFRAGRERPGVRGAAQAHHRGAQVRVAQEGGDVGAQGQGIEAFDVPLGLGPVLEVLQGRDDVLAGHGLDAAEQVGGVLGAGVDRRHRAAAQDRGGDAVPDGLAEAGIEEDLGVVVRVDVDEAGEDPFPAGVDHLGAAGLVERLARDGGDAVADDAEVGRPRLRTGAVEPQSVADDEVVAHGAPRSSCDDCEPNRFGARAPGPGGIGARRGGGQRAATR